MNDARCDKFPDKMHDEPAARHCSLSIGNVQAALGCLPRAAAAPRHAIPTAVQVLLRDAAGRTLFLLRHGTGFFDGYWSLPGGHVEAGESLLQAAARELAEELGIRAAAADLRPVAVIHRASDTNRIEFLFELTSWEGHVRLAEPHRCAELSWALVPPQPLVPYLACLWSELGRRWWFEIGW